MRAELLEDLPLKLPLEVGFFTERGDFLLGKAVDGVPEHALFIGKCKIHSCLLGMLEF